MDLVGRWVRHVNGTTSPCDKNVAPVEVLPYSTSIKQGQKISRTLIDKQKKKTHILLFVYLTF
jgi:hypothetical protein